MSRPPAATARATAASASGTATKNCMCAPLSDSGLTNPISGCSSASMIVELPIWISAWPMRPVESVIRLNVSLAPKALT